MNKSLKNILDDKGIYKNTTGPYFPLHLHLFALAIIYSMLRNLKDGVSLIEILAIIASFITMIAQFGVELNLNQGKIRQYISILRLRFGKFKSYGNPEYLVVEKSKKYLDLKRYMGRIAILFVNPYSLSLVYTGENQDEKSIFICRLYHKKNAMKTSADISVSMDIGLLDLMNGEPKWIRKISK